eukprot:658767-Pelagomonas_calceolata.AAC.1
MREAGSPVLALHKLYTFARSSTIGEHRAAKCMNSLQHRNQQTNAYSIGECQRQSVPYSLLHGLVPPSAIPRELQSKLGW